MEEWEIVTLVEVDLLVSILDVLKRDLVQEIDRSYDWWGDH